MLCFRDQISVLGTIYRVKIKDYKDDKYFEKNSCDGYCDGAIKLIVVCNMKTYPGFEDEEENVLEMTMKQILRHEIVHAFFNESGLCGSSGKYEGAWAKNEEMVDWISIQLEKMHQAFIEAGAI